MKGIHIAYHECYEYKQLLCEGWQLRWGYDEFGFIEFGVDIAAKCGYFGRYNPTFLNVIIKHVGCGFIHDASIYFPTKEDGEKAVKFVNDLINSYQVLKELSQ